MYNTIFINGDPFNCSSYMSLYDLLVYVDFDVHCIVVERNKQIIPTSDFSKVWLVNQDALEIITIVGGG